MKVYKIIENSINMVVGFTDDKNLKDKFLSYRIRENYSVEKVYVNKEEYVKYANQHSMEMIATHKLVTFPDKNIYNRQEINVVMTNSEYEIVMDSVAGEMFSHITICPIHIFNKKYRDALRVLEYEEIYQLSVDCTNKSDDVDLPSVYMDELMIFARINSENLKMKKMR